MYNKDYIRLNKLLRPINRTAKPGCPVIVVDEEFGYKQHILICDIPCKEVLMWLRRQTFGTTYSYINLKKIGSFVHAPITTDISKYYLNGSPIKHHKNSLLFSNCTEDNFFKVYDRLYTLKYKIPSLWFCHLFSRDETFIKINHNSFQYTNDSYKHKFQSHKSCYQTEEFAGDLEFNDEKQLTYFTEDK